jgi:hypothetical protein
LTGRKFEDFPFGLILIQRKWASGAERKRPLIVDKARFRLGIDCVVRRSQAGARFDYDPTTVWEPSKSVDVHGKRNDRLGWPAIKIGTPDTGTAVRSLKIGDRSSVGRPMRLDRLAYASGKNGEAERTSPSRYAFSAHVDQGRLSAGPHGDDDHADANTVGDWITPPQLKCRAPPIGRYGNRLRA